MDKQYSVQFFTRFVEAMQKFCRDYLDFEQTVELSGYLSLEIDNYKKERYVLSEMIHNTGDVMSESYCVKAFKTMKRLPPRTSNSDNVLRDRDNTNWSSDSQPTDHNIPSSHGSRQRNQGNYSQSSSHKYSQFHLPNRKSQASFAEGHAGRESMISPSQSKQHQIQPRSCESRAQKRSSSDIPEGFQSKKEKNESDLDSLYNAATNIVSPSNQTSTSQPNNTSTMPDQQLTSASSESIRLPLTDVSVKQEQVDIILLDDQDESSIQDGTNLSHLDANAYGNDSNLYDNSFGASMSSPTDASMLQFGDQSTMQEISHKRVGRHNLPLRTKLLRAISKYPGPLVPVRNLQRAVKGQNVDNIKLELQILENEGFGEVIKLERHTCRKCVCFQKVDPSCMSDTVQQELLELYITFEMYSRKYEEDDLDKELSSASKF